MRTKYFLVALLLVLIGGCQKKSENTTTGNPSMSMSMTSSSSNATAMNFKKFHFLDFINSPAFAFPAPASLTDSAGNIVILTYNWVSIGEIEFKSTESEGAGEVDGSEIAFAGPYTIDLFSATPSAIGSSVIPSAQIQRIKFKLKKTDVLPSAAPSGLSGKSIYISGQVAGHAFSYSTTEESEVQISGPKSVALSQGKTLLLEVHSANIIKKINLSSINAATEISESNRVIVANPCPGIDSSATDLFTCFRKGIESESNLGRDDDGNFRLDGSDEVVK
ncbi:MAG: hypothetical protein B7Y39_16260 [Bdellovibrio sp. 28-41-41]|nr:MAG: hypothetical protein B7Y39_16260 [Bdellovibrio sp. 28-41-41]